MQQKLDCRFSQIEILLMQGGFGVQNMHAMVQIFYFDEGNCDVKTWCIFEKLR